MTERAAVGVIQGLECVIMGYLESGAVKDVMYMDLFLH